MKVDQIIQEVVDIVARHAGEGVRVLLFGSHAKQNASETSDVDLAIDAGKPLSFEVMIQIKEDVENLPTLRSIDIVDFHNVGEKLKNSILNSHKEVCMK